MFKALVIVMLSAALNSEQYGTMLNNGIVERSDEPIQTHCPICYRNGKSRVLGCRHKCNKKKRVCENCEKLNLKRTCKDGSKPRCPCKCPKRMKVCKNGEQPIFRETEAPWCFDQSFPRCPTQISFRTGIYSAPSLKFAL